MPNIKKIKLGDTAYNICDANAVHTVNLLTEPIVISALENPEDANYIFLDKSLGLAIGGTYTLNYTYKGVTKDIALLGCSQSQVGMGDEEDGIVVLQGIVGRGYSFYTDDNGSSGDASGSLAIMILDKCQATDDGIAYNENSAIILVLVNAENYELPLTINSIINSIAAAETTTIMQNMQNMQNMLVARSSSKFDSLVSSENVGKAISYNKDLYIIDKGAKEIEVGDTLSTIYFDISIEPNLEALPYDEEGTSLALFGIDSGASQERLIISAIRWDDLDMGVSGHGIIGYSSNSADMTVIYSTAAFTVSLAGLTVYKGWNVTKLNLTDTPSITRYETRAKAVLGHILSSAVISSDNPVAISMLKHEEDPTVPAWAKAAEKPEYTYDEIKSKPSLATVATSGSYNDLTNKPTIPTTTSQLTNNSDFATNASVDTKIANLVDSAPEALNTLGELATALETHEDAYDALLETVGNKANKNDLATVATSGNYNNLNNKPTLNGVEITGNKMSADLKLGEVTAEGGFQGGTGATASGGGGAVGNQASVSAGGAAVGYQALAGSGFAGGLEANAVTTGGAVGSYAKASDGFAGGDHAEAWHGTDGKRVLGAVAIGAVAVAQADNAVQLGTGTNTNANTLQFRSYQLVDANGKIPSDRLTGAGASLGGVKSGGDVTITDGVITVNDDSHAHTITNVDGLQSALDGKAASSHGTHVSYGTSASALGTSSAGSAATVSRSDHVHALPALTSCTGTLTVAKGGTGATTAADALSNLGLTATAAELNKMDGVTATTAEINYLDGVTSSIQTQLNGKQAAGSYAAASHTHSASDLSSSGYLNTHPENGATIIPFIHNDLAFLAQKGGTYTIYSTTSTDFTVATLAQTSLAVGSPERMFDGTPKYCIITTTGALTVVVDLVLPKLFEYSNQFYIDFGSHNWHARSISVYAMNSANETSYVLKASTTTNTKGNWFAEFSHTSGSSVSGFNRLRIVIKDFNNTTSTSGKRISQIGLINYNSTGGSETYISRGGCEGVYGSLIPQTNNAVNLGSSSNKWKAIYGTTIYQNGTQVANKSDLPTFNYDEDTKTLTIS